MSYRIIEYKDYGKVQYVAEVSYCSDFKWYGVDPNGMEVDRHRMPVNGPNKYRNCAVDTIAEANSRLTEYYKPTVIIEWQSEMSIGTEDTNYGGYNVSWDTLYGIEPPPAVTPGVEIVEIDMDGAPLDYTRGDPPFIGVDMGDGNDWSETVAYKPEIKTERKHKYGKIGVNRDV